jgi:hypothetical protein
MGTACELPVVVSEMRESGFDDDVDADEESGAKEDDGAGALLDCWDSGFMVITCRRARWRMTRMCELLDVKALCCLLESIL